MTEMKRSEKKESEMKVSFVHDKLAACCLHLHFIGLAFCVLCVVVVDVVCWC
jgi:hypothetical protein